MTNEILAPFGKWDSPISASLIAKSSNSFADVIIDPVTSKVYYLENRPSESGRSVLIDAETKRDVFGSGWNARSGVHEYGGASTIVYGDVAYFSHFSDGRIYKKTSSDADPTPITPGRLHDLLSHLLIILSLSNSLLLIISLTNKFTLIFY